MYVSEREHRAVRREGELKLTFHRKEHRNAHERDKKSRSPLNFKSRTQVTNVQLRAWSTLAALPPFSSTVAAVLEMCNNLEKLTADISWLFALLGSEQKSHTRFRVVACLQTTASLWALNFQQAFGSLLNSASFFSLFLSFPVHNSLLQHTAIFQLSTVQGRRARGNYIRVRGKWRTWAETSEPSVRGSPNRLGDEKKKQTKNKTEIWSRQSPNRVFWAAFKLKKCVHVEKKKAVNHALNPCASIVSISVKYLIIIKCKLFFSTALTLLSCFLVSSWSSL